MLPINHWRGVVTRYDKYALAYLGGATLTWWPPSTPRKHAPLNSSAPTVTIHAVVLEQALAWLELLAERHAFGSYVALSDLLFVGTGASFQHGDSAFEFGFSA